MNSRIFSLLMLIFSIFAGVYVYKTGMLENLLMGQKSVIVVVKPIGKGERIPASSLELRRIPATKAKPSQIVLPADADEGAVVEFAKGKHASSTLKKGHILEFKDLNGSPSVFAARLRRSLSKNDPIDLDVIEAAELSIGSAFVPGVALFPSEESLYLFFDQEDKALARSDLSGGSLLTLEDIARGSARYFVIRAVRDIAQGETITADRLDAFPIEASEAKDGRFVFATSAAASRAAFELEGFRARKDIGVGEFLGVDRIAPDWASAESTELETDYDKLKADAKGPLRGEVLVLDAFDRFDGRFEPGDRIDLWIEKERLKLDDGEGEMSRKIVFEKIAGDLTLKRARKRIDVVSDLMERVDDMSSQDQESPQALEQDPLWDLAVGSRYADARSYKDISWTQVSPRVLDEVLKAAANGDRTVHVLGATEDASRARAEFVRLVRQDPEDREGRILSSRGFSVECRSEEMCAVVASLEEIEGEGDGSNGGTASSEGRPGSGSGDVADGASSRANGIWLRLSSLIDGVNEGMESRLSRAGISGLRDLAEIPPAEISARAKEFGVSAPLLFYIREQASVIMSATAVARRNLGMDEAEKPTEKPTEGAEARR